MRIGIIGAGNIGGALTRRLTALGHQVSVANSRGPESLAGLAAETGAKAVSVPEAARAGEVVVVTIPMKSRTSRACRGTCSRACPRASRSSTPATTTPSSATVASTRLSKAWSKAAGCNSSWVDQ